MQDLDIDARTLQHVHQMADRIVAELRAAWIRACEVVVEFETRCPREERTAKQIEEHGTLLRLRSAVGSLHARACVLRLDVEAAVTSDDVHRAFAALASAAHELRCSSYALATSVASDT